MMVVGHMPHLPRLLRLLLAGDPDASTIEFPVEWGSVPGGAGGSLGRTVADFAGVPVTPAPRLAHANVSGRSRGLRT